MTVKMMVRWEQDDKNVFLEETEMNVRFESEKKTDSECMMITSVQRKNILSAAEWRCDVIWAQGSLLKLDEHAQTWSSLMFTKFCWLI